MRPQEFNNLLGSWYCMFNTHLFHVTCGFKPRLQHLSPESTANTVITRLSGTRYGIRRVIRTVNACPSHIDQGMNDRQQEIQIIYMMALAETFVARHFDLAQMHMRKNLFDRHSTISAAIS